MTAEAIRIVDEAVRIIHLIQLTNGVRIHTRERASSMLAHVVSQMRESGIYPASSEAYDMVLRIAQEQGRRAREGEDGEKAANLS